VIRINTPTICALLVLGVGSLRAQVGTDLRVTSAHDSVVALSDGTEWRPGLWAIRYFDSLPAPHGLPYLVLGAYDCNECDAGPDLWVVRVRSTADSAIALLYPGTHFEMGEDHPYAEARAFVGRCIGNSVALVSWQHPIGDSTGTDSLFAVVPTDRGLRVTRFGPDRMLLARVLNAVRSRRCHELPRLAETH